VYSAGAANQAPGCLPCTIYTTDAQMCDPAILILMRIRAKTDLVEGGALKDSVKPRKNLYQQLKLGNSYDHHIRDDLRPSTECTHTFMGAWSHTSHLLFPLAKSQFVHGHHMPARSTVPTGVVYHPHHHHVKHRTSIIWVNHLMPKE
jgi:hypothetical protein